MPQWLQCFTFSLAMGESSSSFISLPTVSEVDLFFFKFLFLIILIGVQWYLITVLTCASLTIHDGDLLVMCILAIHVVSLVKCLLRSLSLL